MSIKLDIIDHAGNSRSTESAKNIAANTRFGVEKALWHSGKDLQSEFSKQVLAKDKTGRIYFRQTKGGGKRRHRASGPGQTPANRTGAYRKGFGFSVDRADQLRIGVEAIGDGPGGLYPLYLELGTSRMAARPGLGNTVRAGERDILRNLAGEIEGRL